LENSRAGIGIACVGAGHTMSRLLFDKVLRPSAAALVLVAIAGGCTSNEDDAAQDANAITTSNGGISGDETAVFGNDRIGRMLSTHIENIPSDYVGLEKLFQVGRACGRADGKKEIFIVEEPTRGAGPGSVKLPRAVISGCNKGNTADPASVRESYSLFLSLISDPGTPGADQGDTMSVTPQEVMAYDDTTGLFNFYRFTETGTDKPGSVTRFWRDKDDRVMMRTLLGGSSQPSDVQPSPNRACFRCHVDGAPIMNELSEPWTNWISPKKTLSTDGMSGLTKDLVQSASLADQLEGIIRAATQQYVQGNDAATGWLNRTRDGKLVGGIAKMLRPLFCEAELNYLSADSTRGIPVQVFFDPSVVSQSDIQFPEAPAGGVPSPFLFPIRAVYDESVQSTLVDAGYIGFDVAVAIRLLDDQNDIFSPQRCGVFDDVQRALASAGVKPEPATVAALIKKVVADKAPTMNLTPATLAYVKARLAEGDHDAELDAYDTELLTRFDKLDKQIAPKEARRKDLAHAMFPGDSSDSPLPDLTTPN
jgi:hypothetical protein